MHAMPYADPMSPAGDPASKRAKVSQTFRLDPVSIDAAKNLAWQQHLSLTAWVQSAIDEKLASEGWTPDAEG